MSASRQMRERLYRAYMEFFETAERKRRWNLWDDIPWDRLETARATASDRKTAIVEAFCGVELYVPDYTTVGLEWNRNDRFGLAWFYANWGYEESKHALAFREYLTRTGLRTPEQYEAFERHVFSNKWEPPYSTWRQMNAYAALQESFTYLIYRAHREKAERDGDAVLEKICFLTSRDEAAHAGFYRRCLEFELDEDRDGTLADIAHVISHFVMPGFGLVADYENTQHLILGEGGLSQQYFLEHAVYPMLSALGTSRAEIWRAMRRRRVAGLARPEARGQADREAAALSAAGV